MKISTAIGMIAALCLAWGLCPAQGTNMQLLSRSMMNWEITKDMDTQGDRLAVSTGSTGVRFLDISDPDHLQESSYYQTAESIDSVILQGNLAFIGGFGYFRILSLANIHMPVQMGSYLGNFAVKSIAVAGSYAYVALSMGYQRLLILDVSNPSNPALASTIDPGISLITSIVTADSLLYMGQANGQFSLWDISVPTSPQMLGSYTTHMQTTDINIRGNHAYLAAPSGMFILDVSNPNMPVPVGYLNSQELGAVVCLSVQDDSAYLCGSHGILCVDVSDPSNPQLLASLNQSGYDYAVIGQNRFYVAGDKEVTVFQVAGPEPFVQTGSFTIPQPSWELSTSGSNVFLLTRWDSIKAIDASNPVFPTVVGEYPLYTLGPSVIQGNRLYAAQIPNQICIYDITDPADLVVLATLTYGPIDIRELAVSGDLLFIGSAYGNGVRIQNVSDPANVVGIANISTIGDVGGLAVGPNTLYINDYSQLRIVDITVPAQPVLIYSQGLSSYSRGLALDGNWLYAAYSTRVDLYDVSDPSNPRFVNQLHFNDVQNISLQGNYLYIACRAQGVFMYRRTPSETLQLVGSYNTPGSARDIEVFGTNVYVADTTSFIILSSLYTASPEAEELIPAARQAWNHPNPFRGKTTISFTRSKPGSAKVSIYNQRGQLVREYHNVTGAEIEWDGKDDRGRDIAPGVYFYRVSMNGTAFAGSCLLMGKLGT